MNNNIQLHNIDCFEYMKTLPDNSIDSIITDPPYFSTALQFDKNQGFTWEDLFNELFRITKDSGNIVIFTDMRLAAKLINTIKYYRYEIVWEKSNAVGFLSANKRPLRAHEFILIFGKQPDKSIYNPQKTAGTPYKGNTKGRVKAKHYTNYKVSNLDTL